MATLPLSKKALEATLAAQTKHLDQKLQEQTKELKSYSDKQTEKLAQIVNGAFQNQHDFMADHFGKIDTRLGTVEIKLDRALYIENTHLEVRIQRLEKHTGLKSPKPE